MEQSNGAQIKDENSCSIVRRLMRRWWFDWPSERVNPEDWWQKETVKWCSFKSWCNSDSQTVPKCQSQRAVATNVRTFVGCKVDNSCCSPENPSSYLR